MFVIMSINEEVIYLDKNRIIFHVDVNSAFLSWIAKSKLENGEKLDIRNVPSVVGGDIDSRHGIVLAKSQSAKKYNISTAETIYSATLKCKNLVVVKPDFNLFNECSKSMFKLLEEYTPLLERYSIDEGFLDMTHCKDNYMEKACEISKIGRAHV